MSAQEPAQRIDVIGLFIKEPLMAIAQQEENQRLAFVGSAGLHSCEPLRDSSDREVPAQSYEGSLFLSDHCGVWADIAFFQDSLSH